MSPRGKEWLLRLALVSGSLLLIAGGLELGLRLLGSDRGDWYAAGPERLRFLREHVARNRHGFRDREFTVPKPPGTVRILAVGDSFTFGDGIERIEDTWPRVLERRLAEHGRFEVLNLGIPGTNTSFQRRMLARRNAYDLEPDRVVLGFVLNDPEPDDANRAIVPERLYRPLLPWTGLDARLTRGSYAYAWTRRAKNGLLERFGLKETYDDYLHELFEPETDHWSDFRREVAKLIAELGRREVALTVALFPMFRELEAYPFEREHEIARELFRAEGADVIDLLDVFRGRTTSEFHVSPGDAHPNEAAHRIAAETIATHLLSR